MQLMRYANNNKANIYCIKNFMSISKTKLKIDFNVVSDETDTKQKNLQFTRKAMGSVHNNFW